MGDTICLVGEPGIGKSRLAYELQRHPALPPPVEGATQAYARRAAYLPLLRQLAGLSPDEDLAAARDALHRRLWDLSPDVAAYVPDVLPILGTSCERSDMLRDTPADGRRDRVQEAVVAWVVAECRQAPRLVLLEDVHWLDPSSEDLCRRLARVARELPLLLLMTSRLPLAGCRLEVAGVREIRLRSLAADDIAALVDAQLDPYPARERLRRAVGERAQGNPFYAEELVRAFRERGDLVLADGAYDLTADAAALVPPTLHALIAARIDRLSPSARD